MLSLPNGLKVFVASDPTDMRLSFDGLSLRIQDNLEHNPLSGGLYVFFNRNRNRVKILYWDRNGICIWYKRSNA
jgi:transposase